MNGPTLVITAAWGGQIPVRNLICPRPASPISTAQSLVLPFSPNLSGGPVHCCSFLRNFTANRSAEMRLILSLVVVLPLLPVTANYWELELLKVIPG